jgi:hypothetical protein
MVVLDGHMLATYRNGDVKIFDPTGGEKYLHPSRGDHTSNTAVAVMTHPIDNKQMLLCGQQYGYITAYDLPDFRPRGSWCCKNGSDIRAIADVQSGGMLVTGGAHADVMMWKWGASQQGMPSSVAAPVVANPFAGAPQPCGGFMGAPAPGSAPAFGGGGCLFGAGGGNNMM